MPNKAKRVSAIILATTVLGTVAAQAEGGFDPGSYTTQIVGYGSAALLAGVVLMTGLMGWRFVKKFIRG
jgi:hypothetical protein